MTAIVLLPGMDGSGVMFAEFRAALGTKSIVVSYPPDQPLGYCELKELARRALPVDEPFIILAESFSGPVAIALAAAPLPGLKAVVLVCTFAQSPGPRLPRLLQTLVTSLPFWRAPVALLAAVSFGRFNSAMLKARLSAAVRAVTPAVWKARLRAVLSVDVTPELSRIGVPILYLRASADRVVFRSASQLIARHNSRVQIVEIEGPHLLLQAKPKEAAAAIAEFVRRL